MDLELARKTVATTIDTIYSTGKIEDFEATIKNIKKKAKKAKLFNIRVEMCYVDDTDDNLHYGYIKVVGDRLETEKEWQERLTLNKRSNERWIKEIEENYNALRLYKEIDEKYEKALASIGKQ